MSDKLTTEHTGDLTPQSRARILGEVLTFLTPKMEPVPYGVVLRHIMAHFSASEEITSVYVMQSVFELAYAGLIASNTFHTASDEKCLMVAAETTLSPSRKLTGYAYQEAE